MFLKCFKTPGLAVHSYLIYDEKSHRGAVIDPTREIETYLNYAKEQHIMITDILETHVHADFISGAPELKKALNEKPTIHCSGMGGKEWIPVYADHIVKERDSVQLGTIRLEALHTPGHTPEHIVWVVFDEERSRTIPALIFTGDLLFVGSVGRPDLLGNELEESLFKQLYHSLFVVIQALPEFTEIYPAHGAGSLCGKAIGTRDSSTLGYEKRCNQWMIPQEFKKWKELLQNISAPPPYFLRMKKLNVTGLKKSEASEPLVIDIRNAEAFAKSHLKGSINVPFGPTFVNWAGIAIPENQSLILVANNSKEAEQATQALRLIGLDSVQKIINGNEWLSQQKEEDLVPLPIITAKELLDTHGKYTIIDVRTPSEWNSGHLEGAHLIELTRAYDIVQSFAKTEPLAIVCRSGSRSSIVTSILARAGFENAVSVRGGMQAILNEKG